MPRTGGDLTRRRILEVAEKLFSKRGFDATSVDEIARAAGVNKALIYYHFESKNDLVLKLFESIIEEVAAHVEHGGGRGDRSGDAGVKREIREEVEFLVERKPILSLMLSDALRSGPRGDFLFRCAELVMRSEYGEDLAGKGSKSARRRERQRHLVYEFFTGFIPVVVFVALRDKWCKYFDGDPDRMVDDFVEAFAGSHLAAKSKGRWRGRDAARRRARA